MSRILVGHYLAVYILHGVKGDLGTLFHHGVGEILEGTEGLSDVIAISGNTAQLVRIDGKGSVALYIDTEISESFFVCSGDAA